MMTNRKKLKSIAKYRVQVHAHIENFHNRTPFESNNLLEAKKVPNVFFNICFDKNNLKTVIAWFLEQYGEKMTVDLVETLKQVGFHQATRAGVSLGVDDLQIPPQKPMLLSKASVKMGNVNSAIQTGNLTSVEKSQRLIDTWNQTSETLRQTAVQNFRTTNPVNPVYMMAFSGARGNISQVRQLVAMRGLMADPQGAILEFPIQSNFREGLTVTEYLISCYGARKGLVDTALRTATSGYLTRRLVDAVQHVVVHVKNCQTQKGLLIKEKNIEQRLIGRVLLNDIFLDANKIIKKNTLISPRLAKQIAAKHNEISIRSPLTCETEKSVCQFCYGVDLAQGKLVSIGEAVGIIAAQSIGEPGTQLTMRTFHTGGVGVFSDQAMKSFSAPFDGKVEFLRSLPGLFVRTPHGNIVYLLKHKELEQDQDTPILRLMSSGDKKDFLSTPLQKSVFYEIKQSEVPPESLVWVKQGEFVKTGQLLLQASRLQTSKQEMPESSHPVRAPLSGEIFFQSMAIRVIEEQKTSSLKGKKKKYQNFTLSQINQKEISPTFPTLIELGNFWIFSTFVQKESQISGSFFVRGDLFSPETPIQQYNLELTHKGQLKKFNSSIIFGQSSIDFVFSKIYYSGFCYFLVNSFEKKKPLIFGYTSNSKSTLLTWYPFLENQPVGYCTLISFSSEFFPYKSSDKKEFLSTEQSEKTGLNKKSDVFKHNYVSYIWSPHQLFKLKRFPNFSVNNIFSSDHFIINLDHFTLSKTGLFQNKNQASLVWLKKKKFSLNFIKNFQKNSINFIPFSKNPVFGTKSLGPENFIFGERSKSLFFEKGLKISHGILDEQTTAKIIEKKQTWFYLPETSLSSCSCSQLTGVLLEPGKQFENISFQNSYVSASILYRKQVSIVKTISKVKHFGSFYSVKEIFNSNIQFKTEKTEIFSYFKRYEKNFANSSGSFTRLHSNLFCFYKKQESDKNKFRDLSFQIKRKQLISHILVLQKSFEQFFAGKEFFKNKWFLHKKLPGNVALNSPLFTKQHKTSFEVSKKTTRLAFTTVTPLHSLWSSEANFFKVQIEFATPKTFRKLEEFKHKIFISKKQILNKNSCYEFVIPGLSLMLYRRIYFKNSYLFKFQTFSNGWILPEFTITRAFIKSKKLGEFRRIQRKQEGVSFNLLRSQDISILPIPDKKVHNEILKWSGPKNEFLGIKQVGPKNKVFGKGNEPKLLFSQKVGTKLRWAQQIVPGFASPISGQIIKTTRTTLIIQKGIPLLASVRGLVHISHNDLIEKNDLLITLRSRRLQTEDIVQGIPKIEQLFEARETQGGEIIHNNMHMLLRNFFTRALQVKPVSEAVQLSLKYIQKFLVENILQAYSNQGVHIAEKHVEIVVRQMTTRVRITDGGETGFLPGEFVQLRLIEKINLSLARLGRRKAEYEPVILGITKSVLQSESFLLAASFQQVSKVLVKSALAKKTDFLRGLHENILVGQPIPAGTGLIDINQFTQKQTEQIEKGENFISTNLKSNSRQLEPSSEFE